MNHRHCADILPSLQLPPDCNYIGVFLTFACDLHCSYCINRHGELRGGGRHLAGDDWLRGLNRLVSRPDLPVTFQGGEPTQHPDFYRIVKGLDARLPIDLLSNLQIDPVRFSGEIPPQRLRRQAPYASIRVSYHPETMVLEPLAERVLGLQSAGYSIGIWGVLHPDQEGDIRQAQEYCLSRGIDFRTKEFLGRHNGVLYGNYRYPGACDGGTGKSVRCRTTELLIGPDGSVFRCHSDLYAGRGAIGHLLDPALAVGAVFRSCDNFGACHPCDVKLKTDRFQIFGHTSVEIVAAG
jgi:hypothetical protein